MSCKYLSKGLDFKHKKIKTPSSFFIDVFKLIIISCSNYINKAIKIANLEYNSNSCIDLILPQASKADRILLIGIDNNDLSESYRISKIGSFITSTLNNKKISQASIVINKDIFKDGTAAHLLYGISLNSYRFNKYFSEKKRYRNNYINKINFISENLISIKNTPS
jgi:leucyl aminopeptidase